MHPSLGATEVQIYLIEEAEPWSPFFPSPCLGWMEGRASAGDSSGEVHTMNTGSVSKPFYQRGRYLLAQK